MAGEDDVIYWYDPDPRAILPFDNFHISRSLSRILNKGGYEVRHDTSFDEVIRACAASAPGREETWINQEIVEAYSRLARLGFAHSVEIWRDSDLVGGLYGVAINGFFAGESMFSRSRDASKIALVHLVDHLQQQGFLLLDVQFLTEHLRTFGAVEVPRYDYKQTLAVALSQPVIF